MNHPNPDAAPNIATSEEVLATFTELMRGDKSAERLKAAEQLAKHYNLFSVREDAGIPPAVIEEVERAVAALQAAMLPDE